jgi:hypothetical protein
MGKYSEASFEGAEILRAKWIIDKAQREKTDVVATLVQHMVSKTLIEQLTGKSPESRRVVKKDKDAQLREWALAHLEQEVTTQQIADGLEVSVATALKLTKENTDYFTKVKRGVFAVRDGVAEREETRRNKPSKAVQHHLEEIA